MERLLVTGMDSLAGSNLALGLAEYASVLALYEQHRLDAPALQTAPWQPTDMEALRQHLVEWRPQAIIHCGPLATCSWDAPPSPQAAEREPLVAARLAELAREFGCRLIVLSSDAVFAGPRMFHEESYPTASSSPLAMQVRAMERALEQSGALVLRTHVYGWSFVPGTAGFAERAFDALTTSAPIAADGLRHATPILATDLAELLMRASELRLHGLYHLSGAERTSTYRFVQELASVCGMAMPNVRPAAADARCDQETSLSSKRARRILGVATPTLREGLERFAEQERSGFRTRLQTGKIFCHAA